MKNKICPLCGLPDATSPHYIIPLSENGDDIPENIVYLCKVCHDDVEEDPKLWARFLRHYYSDRLSRFSRERRKKLGLVKPLPVYKLEKEKKSGVKSEVELVMEELSIGRADAEAVIRNLSKHLDMELYIVKVSLRRRSRGITDYRIRRISSALASIKHHIGGIRGRSS